MKNKELQTLAKQIANIETKYSANSSSNEELAQLSLEIENLIKNLSFEDLLELDERITEILSNKN